MDRMRNNRSRLDLGAQSAAPLKLDHDASHHHVRRRQKTLFEPNFEFRLDSGHTPTSMDQFWLDRVLVITWL